MNKQELKRLEKLRNKWINDKSTRKHYTFEANELIGLLIKESNQQYIRQLLIENNRKERN